MKRIYLDNAATTALRPEVADTMHKILLNEFGNPSSTHHYGQLSKSIIETSRKTIASLIGAQPSELVFTSGGTEADNMVLQSSVRDLGIERIISSPIEHHAVLHTLEELQSREMVSLDLVKLEANGQIDLQHLEELLSREDRPTLVSLMHVNNELGNITDLKRVGTICRAHAALFHSDMVQSVGHFPVDFGSNQVDFAAVSAHKFHGPKGVGFAYVRKGSGLKSLIFGGQQERGLRAGTEPVYAIAGMSRALERSVGHLEDERPFIQGLKDHFVSRLQEAIPGIKFNGDCLSAERSTYTLVNVCLPLPPEKALMLLFQLDLKGIACSQGSACQSGSAAGSHVLKAVLDEEDLKKPSVRFSFCKDNTKEELDYVVEVLSEFVKS